MTAHRNDATLESDAQKHSAARPDRGQADDGKTGGKMQGGKPGRSQFGGAGTTSERYAPGASTDKKADDRK